MGKTDWEQTQSPSRLWIVQARDVPVAAILRRGPSRWVRLLLWNTQMDTFYGGQWFHGRIAEGAIHLTPSGKRLLYYAETRKEPYYVWTAISRPPFLTALALWTSEDRYLGGGYFASENEIVLNYSENNPVMTEGFHLPKSTKILLREDRKADDSLRVPLPEKPWVWERNGHAPEPWLHAPLRIKPSSSHVWTRRNPIPSRKCELVCIGVPDPLLYVSEKRERNVVVRYAGGDEMPLGVFEWADWTNDGDFAFARAGCLYRLGWDRARLLPIESARLLMDFTPMVFQECVAPDGAKTWNQDFDLEPYRILV